jgi:4-amino-4-deoxy-L-arabinose transferase-like glycosyltransferase
MTSLSVALMVMGRRLPWLKLLAWAVAGLAVMAKGPIGLGVPVLALLPEVVRPTYAEAPSSLFGRLWKLWPFAGLVVVVAVTAPFYLAMHSLTGEEGTLYLLWNQGFGRLWGKSGFIDDTTPLFFVHTALWAFLPFSLVLFTALSRRLSMLLTTRRLPGSLSRVPLWWFGLTFLVISLSTYKLPHYLFVLTVPAALLTAEELERFDDRAASRWRLGFLVLSVIAVSEFTLAAQEVNAFTYSTLECYLPLAAGYLLLTLPLSALSRLLERRFKYET